MSRLRAFTALCCALALDLSGCERVVREPIGLTSQPVLYGADDRREPYEESGVLHELASERSVALMPTSSLRVAGSFVQIDDEPAGERWGLCSDEAFAQQPSAAECSGLLIAPDLVLTAGHCLLLHPCRDWSIVRNFAYEAADRLHALQVTDVARCSRLEVFAHASDASGQLDYAVLRMDRPLLSSAAPALQLAPPHSERAGMPVALIGNGLGLPTKIDAAGRTTDARASHDDFFQIAADNYEGGSGAGVFDLEGRLLGVAARGAADFEFDDATGCSRSRRLAPSDGVEQVSRARTALEALCRKNRGAIALCEADAVLARSPSGGCSAASSRGGPREPASWCALAFVALAYRQRCRKRRQNWRVRRTS